MEEFPGVTRWAPFIYREPESPKLLFHEQLTRRRTRIYVAARPGSEDEFHGSTARFRGCGLRLEFLHEQMEGFLVLDDHALALIEFVEALFGCLPECFQFGFAFFFLRFQQAQRFADNFAGVLVTAGGNLALDEIVEVIGEVDVACWHGVDDSRFGNFCQWVKLSLLHPPGVESRLRSGRMRPPPMSRLFAKRCIVRMLASSLVLIGVCIVAAADLLMHRPTDYSSSTAREQTAMLWFAGFVTGAFAIAVIVYDIVLER